MGTFVELLSVARLPGSILQIRTPRNPARDSGPGRLARFISHDHVARAARPVAPRAGAGGPSPGCASPCTLALGPDMAALHVI